MSSAPDPKPRPLIGGAAMSAASRITVAATGAATTILIARLLGPDGSGGYAIAQTLIVLLTVGTTLGVEHGIVYYVSQRRWPAREALAVAHRVALVTGTAGAGLGLLARLLVPSAFGGLSVALTAVAAGALPFALTWFYTTYVALARDRYEAYAIMPALQSTLALALVTALAATVGLPGAVVGFAAAHVLTAVAAWVVVRRVIAAVDPSTPAGAVADDAPAGNAGEDPGAGRRSGGLSALGQLARAVRFGVKGYAANALQMVNYRLDVFILAGVATVADVGHYSVAVAVTGVMLLLPAALSDVLFPRVAALSRDNSGHASRDFVETKALRHAVIVVAVSTGVLALALVLLVVPVYGPDFRASVELGLILLPGVALIALNGPLAASYVGRGHPGWSLAIACITTPLTIALYLLLIPPLAATGAALASTLSYASTFGLSMLASRRVTGLPILRRLVPTRSELADYRALAPAVRAWARGLMRRPRHESSS